MKKRGQISVEYMMIIAISMMIILPGIYLFRNYAFESNDKLLKTRVAEVSSQVLGKARKMHYYGPPSKSILNVEMPPSINNMYVLDVNDQEFYLVFQLLTSTGQEDVLFESDIPIRVDNNEPCTIDNCQGTCTCFHPETFSQGLKNIKVESREQNGFFYIDIEEISAYLN